MKKFFLSIIVLGAFFLYSLHHRFENEEVIIKQNPPATDGSITPIVQPTVSSSSSSSSSPSPLPTQTTGKYKDGVYTGDPKDAFYGMIQVQATISGGRLVNVKFLQYPNDRDTSILINQQADPMLTQEAITAQSADVQIISGATDSSEAFVQSLQSALNQAK